MKFNPSGSMRAKWQADEVEAQKNLCVLIQIQSAAEDHSERMNPYEGDSGDEPA